MPGAAWGAPRHRARATARARAAARQGAMGRSDGPAPPQHQGSLDVLHLTGEFQVTPWVEVRRSLRAPCWGMPHLSEAGDRQDPAWPDLVSATDRGRMRFSRL